jgi:hypothetical protein
MRNWWAGKRQSAGEIQYESFTPADWMEQVNGEQYQA